MGGGGNSTARNIAVLTWQGKGKEKKRKSRLFSREKKSPAKRLVQTGKEKKREEQAAIDGSTGIEKEKNGGGQERESVTVNLLLVPKKKVLPFCSQSGRLGSRRKKKKTSLLPVQEKGVVKAVRNLGSIFREWGGERSELLTFLMLQSRDWGKGGGGQRRIREAV